jgi:uncharacterized membrane protein
VKILKIIMKYLLALFFVVAGVNHFLNPEFYTNIMPGYMSWHYELVIISGVTEILAGVLLAIPKTSRIGAWAMVAMLLAFMPVHVHMIMNATQYSDVPLVLLWVRIPLQFVFILWAWWFTRPERSPVAVHEQAATV